MLGVISLLYHNLDWKTLVVGIPALFLLVHVLPYILDPQRIRQHPGPFLARFSDVWLGWVAKNGHRSEVVHAMHEKYGKCLPHLNLPFTDPA